jgi:hypothetical protein
MIVVRGLGIGSVLSIIAQHSRGDQIVAASLLPLATTTGRAIVVTHARKDF